MDRAAFSGTYSDLKLVKTRSVAVVHVEIPIEQAAAFVSAFGMPEPGKERPVALALLNTSPGAVAAPTSGTGQQSGEAGKPRAEKKRWDEMSRAQRAGILCGDPRFAKWLAPLGFGNGPEDAADWIRGECGVRSRSEIDGNPEAERKFDALVAAFRQETGQAAEVRG